MLTFRRFSRLAVSCLLAVAISACSTTTTSINKLLLDRSYEGAEFSNYLVIGAADNYDNRAQFERTVVSELRRRGASATAYYTVIGHNPPITASDVQNAVRARDFDAVLFTRVKGSMQDINVKTGPSAAKSTVIGGDLFNLFRYDYQEFDEPDNVRISTNVVLITELYAAADEKKIWVLESESYDRESTGQIIDSEAETIVNRLDKDGLVGAQ